MIKKSLREWVGGNNDYSAFAEKRDFSKYPLIQMVNDTGKFHKVKTAEAFQALRALCTLTLEEYFRYVPECIERLTELPSLNEYTYDDFSAMTVGDFFRMMEDVIDTDYCSEYRAVDEKMDVCWIFIKPVIDSGYRHPLFYSSFKHNLDVIGDDYTGKQIVEKHLLQNMNTFVRDTMCKMSSAKLNQEDVLEKMMSVYFFNYIIRPVIGVLNDHGDISAIYSTTD